MKKMYKSALKERYEEITPPFEDQVNAFLRVAIGGCILLTVLFFLAALGYYGHTGETGEAVSLPEEDTQTLQGTEAAKEAPALPRQGGELEIPADLKYYDHVVVIEPVPADGTAGEWELINSLAGRIAENAPLPCT